MNNDSCDTTDLFSLYQGGNLAFNRAGFARYTCRLHIADGIQPNDTVVDFGCGNGKLLKTMLSNYRAPAAYIGYDKNRRVIESLIEEYSNFNRAKFYTADLVNTQTDFSKIKADKVCALDVIELIGKCNIHAFLKNFKNCGAADATYYLSATNFDPTYKIPGIHFYDAKDGRGKDIQEFDHYELEAILKRHFIIIEKFGTFAYIKDYKDNMNDWQRKAYEALSEYFTPSLVSNIMAPMFPDEARNTLWVLKRKPDNSK